MAITELRILPPLAVARLGSSAEPLENYDLVVEDPLGHRKIEPAETLRLDPETGEVVEAYVPRPEIKFRDGPHIRPVAPFLEVFARTTDDTLEPLTIDILAAEGLSPADVRWTVTLGNIKAFRRTGDDNDKIVATSVFNDHARHALEGECVNFLPGKTLPLGTARYLKPTRDFPQIRLRYMPAAGLVYGANARRMVDEGSDEFDPVVAGRVIYDDKKGAWRGYFDKGAATETNPGAIYASFTDKAGNHVSRGYLDDECDGIVAVQLTVGGRELRAFARIGAGHPSFAPNGLPIRTVADELEQAMFGPRVDLADISPAEVEGIVRRAFETVRLLNTAVMNGNPVNGRLAQTSIMPSQDANDFHRMFEPIMATALVDSLSVAALHQTVLTALKSGTPAWFADALREPDEIGDLSDKGRRKMPAMMRGADARYLTLTRRQIDMIRKSVVGRSLVS